MMVALAATAAQAASPLVYLRDIDASIRQDMRYAGADNFTGRPLPGSGAGECMLRRPVAIALKAVQAELAGRALSLKVYDCYRPTRAVAAMARWSRGAGGPDTSRFYPAAERNQLFALGYISGFSAHSRGVAVDLTIGGSGNHIGSLKLNGKPLPAGSRKIAWSSLKGKKAKIELIRSKKAPNHPVKLLRGTGTNS